MDILKLTKKRMEEVGFIFFRQNDYEHIATHCTCDALCTIVCGLGVIPGTPNKLAVLIPSALNKESGAVVTYTYSDDVQLIVHLLKTHFKDEHRKGCRIMKRAKKPKPTPL